MRVGFQVLGRVAGPPAGQMVTWSCPQVGCNKVYTSTSDVMTHENFHKKNTQLINDGFQRFRATEDCGTADCQFYGQKTTHFHCRWAPPRGSTAC